MLRPIYKLITCKRCGASNLGFALSHVGKWYLCGTITLDGKAYVDSRNFHTCVGKPVRTTPTCGVCNVAIAEHSSELYEQHCRESLATGVKPVVVSRYPFRRPLPKVMREAIAAAAESLSTVSGTADWAHNTKLIESVAVKSKDEFCTRCFRLGDCICEDNNG